MAYEFHYTPTGTGVISGKEVLEQTEDAINDLGNTAISGVQEAVDKAEQALTNSANAVDDAQTALNTANNAEGVAIQAQNDVSNLSETVTNLGNRVTTDEGNITDIQGRMTTAEGNITNLQGRMTTAEGNIGNLQTAVSTAQATANSAQQTATLARGQAYVTRYTNTAVSDNSTVAYSDLNNTDNIKIGDFILDVNGKLYAITAVDTANETVSVTTPLTQLAVDSSVMHLTGDESSTGKKIFGDMATFGGSYLGNESSANARTDIVLESNRDTHGQSGVYITKFRQNKEQGSMSGNDVVYVALDVLENSVRKNQALRVSFTQFVNDIPTRIVFYTDVNGDRWLGTAVNKWTQINGLNPGCLSMPDLDNGVDISSYITVNGGNKESIYTPPANGWISVALTRTEGSSMAVMLKQGNFASSGHNIAQENGTTTCNAMLPVKGGVQVSINSALADGIAFAYFYPCLGNV